MTRWTTANFRAGQLAPRSLLRRTSFISITAVIGGGLGGKGVAFVGREAYLRGCSGLPFCDLPVHGCRRCAGFAFWTCRVVLLRQSTETNMGKHRKFRVSQFVLSH